MHNWLRCLRSGAHLGAISPAGAPAAPRGGPRGPPRAPPRGPPWGVGMGCRDVSAFNTVTRSGCYKQSAASARSGGRAMLTKTSCNRRLGRHDSRQATGPPRPHSNRETHPTLRAVRWLLCMSLE